LIVGDRLTLCDPTPLCGTCTHCGSVRTVTRTHCAVAPRTRVLRGCLPLPLRTHARVCAAHVYHAQHLYTACAPRCLLPRVCGCHTLGLLRAHRVCAHCVCHAHAAAAYCAAYCVQVTVYTRTRFAHARTLPHTVAHTPHAHTRLLRFAVRGLFCTHAHTHTRFGLGLLRTHGLRTPRLVHALRTHTAHTTHAHYGLHTHAHVVYTTRFTFYRLPVYTFRLGLHLR